MKKRKEPSRPKNNLELAKRLRKISDTAIASGLQPMTPEEIEKEVERRRGTA